jgi:hypothetical protein
MEILKDGFGKPQGIIREIAGGQKRLYTPTGEPSATYRSRTNATYDNNGTRIGTGDRLAGLVESEE